LHKAATEGNTNSCRLLIEAGAQKDMKDKNKVTALDCAIYFKHKETAIYLKD
jgi:ankyrin repeat protein